jgi:hypothetical protein
MTITTLKRIVHCSKCNEEILSGEPLHVANKGYFHISCYCDLKIQELRTAIELLEKQKKVFGGIKWWNLQRMRCS